MTTGRPEKIVEPVQDGGEQIVTRGTHTQLVGDLTLTYDGVTVPLQLDTAFGYDLEVRKVALYGREYLVAIRPQKKGLVMYTLHHDAEIRSIDQIDELKLSTARLGG